MNIVFMSMDTLPSTLWARDLYDQMHIRSDFRKWFPRMCQYGFIEGRDYEYMPRVRLQDEGGRTVQRYVKDYRISQDMAKKLCKLHHTTVGAMYHPQPFDWDKDILQPGYTAKPVPFVEPEKDKDVPFPKKMEQGMVLPVVRAEKKQGFTSPPKVYTEDTLLSAMETAGNKEFEKDTEKKGLGTPATRAAILEKLVSSGYVQRKGKQIIPTEDGVAAIHNIPDYLKSASMTAEWENDLLRMERGEIKPHDFMQGIHGLLDKMLADLRQIPTVAAVPYYNKVSVGSCPVCGNPVHESKLSFCCADRSCKFALWKESRYLSNMRKTLDKKMAVDLLKKGRTHVKDFYSVKKDKTFAADLVMRVEDGRAQYSLEFPRTPMKTKT